MIRSAKCRYIFHNRSRSKLNSEFILAVGNGLASAIHGVLLDHISREMSRIRASTGSALSLPLSPVSSDNWGQIILQ